MLGAIAFNLIEFLNYFLTYKIVLNIKFTKRKLPYFIMILGSCFVQIFVYTFLDKTKYYIITIILGFLSAVLLTESIRWKTALFFPIVFALTSLIDGIGLYLISTVLKVNYKEVLKSYLLTFAVGCTTVIVLLVYNKLEKQTSDEKVKFLVVQYIFILLGICSLILIVRLAHGIVSGEIDYIKNNKNVIAIVFILVAFCFVALNICLQITWKKIYRYGIENEKYKLFLSQQEEYVHMMINQDENRRKLYHDINAHMMAMEKMLENNQFDEFQQYFVQMQEYFGSTQAEKYIGIAAVDAIVSEFHDKAISKNAKWSWQGNSLPYGAASVFELCVLFSNLLGNAVEALDYVQNERKIQIKVINIQEKVFISIGNTCNKDININQRPKSTKSDEIYHGLGLRNVEEVIKRHDGTIKYQCKDGWFQVDIVL